MSQKKSWKTTAGGAAAALGIILVGVGAFLDNDPTTNVDMAGIMKAIGALIAAIGVGGAGIAARDNGVSSEDAGAK